MKTTPDLPEALVNQIKLRAVREGRKLKDAVADLLRKGLAVAADREADVAAPVITRDKKTGLPLIACQQAAAPGAAALDYEGGVGALPHPTFEQPCGLVRL